MIFSAELLPKVLDGTKTVTRRRAKRHEATCYYQAGRTYPVQSARGKKAVARILVTSVQRELFSDITREEAWLEGFQDASEMRLWWVTRYGQHAYTAPVWRIAFELAL